MRWCARCRRRTHGDADIEALYGVSGTGTRLDANPTESGENVAKLSVVLGEHYSRADRGRRDRAHAQDHGAVSRTSQVKFGRPQLFSFSTPLEIEIARPAIWSRCKRAGRQAGAS